jgi:hypothetical protein
MSSHDPFVGQNLQIQIIKSNNPIGLGKKNLWAYKQPYFIKHWK